jgi:deoxyribose-phosphate aldolase
MNHDRRHDTIQDSRRNLAGIIDHTLLAPEADEERIRRLCEEAMRFGFATVCVNPIWVRLAFRELERSPVGVCTVVGFPLGTNTPAVKLYETQRALSEGADEIDMVMSLGTFKSGDYKKTEEDISGVVRCCKESDSLSKVIIETALLGPEEKVEACRLVAATGADYVKTSTGFGPGGATLEDVRLIRRVVGKTMGIKAAGGIRSAVTAGRMIEAGANRIGTSSGVRIVGEPDTSNSIQETV